MIVTGSKGFIGSRILGKYGTFGLDKSNFHELTGINDDLVIHTGALTRIRESIAVPEDYFKWNVQKTFDIFEYCRKHDADIIFFSSSRTLSRNNNPYTASKSYGEQLCKAYKECYGVKYKLIRPSTVYGPEDSNRLVPIFIDNALNNRPLEIFGDMNKTLCFTYIDDFMKAFDLILNKGKWNTDYNVGGETRKVLDAAEFIVKETGSSSMIVFSGQEKAQPQKVEINDSKTRNLGYFPLFSLENGLKETIKWTQRHRFLPR